MRVDTGLRAAGYSHPGLQRRTNEDRFHYDPSRGIFLVVDGVGGHAAGEEAADTAVSWLRTRLERQTGPLEDRIREAITIANNEIHRRASQRSEWKGMGCVLTVAVVDNGSVTIGHVGDTRLYKLRGSEIVKVTRDHSPVGEREDARELSEAEAMRHPRRNEVYRDVGTELHEPADPDFIDVLHVPLESDAALLLCSDGLTDSVPSATIRDIVMDYAGHPEQTVRALIDAANDAGGKDNVTSVYVERPAFAERARRGGAAARRPPVHPPNGLEASLGAQLEPVRVPQRRWVTAMVALLLAVVVGASAWQLGARIPWEFVPSLPWFSTGRQIIVQPSQSIAAALERASAGSEVLLEPGEYRERLRLKSGVRVRSRVPRAASIRLPGGASESEAAVMAADIVDAELSGLRIVGDAATPLGIGLMVRNAGVVLSDLEISGAYVTAIEIVSGGGATILGANVHDNPGAGLTIRAPSAPRIVHSQFVRNGMSDRAAGSIVIDAGAAPDLFGNVFHGIAAEALTGLSPAARATVRSANWFIPSDEPTGARPARPAGGRR